MWKRGHFLTLEEAEAWAKGEDMRSLGFCPVINFECNPKCVCFNKSVVSEVIGVRTKGHTVTAPGCTNPLVSGFIEVSG